MRLNGNILDAYLFYSHGPDFFNHITKTWWVTTHQIFSDLTFTNPSLVDTNVIVFSNRCLRINDEHAAWIITILEIVEHIMYTPKGWSRGKLYHGLTSNQFRETRDGLLVTDVGCTAQTNSFHSNRQSLEN